MRKAAPSQHVDILKSTENQPSRTREDEAGTGQLDTFLSARTLACSRMHFQDLYLALTAYLGSRAPY